jgi:hypothetical protein
MLHDPARHETLCEVAWSEPAARQFIQTLADQVCERFDPHTLWPIHPRDIEPGEAALPVACLYHGAAGVIWALQHLKRHAAVSVEVDFTDCIDGLIEHNQRFNLASGIDPRSYLLGDPGVLLLQWQATQSPAVAHSLFDLVQANLHNPSHESLFGSSGTMVAALHMLEATREDRWLQLFRNAAQIVCDQMHLAPDVDDTWIWTQTLYGQTCAYLGAGHGFAGNMFPFVRGAEWLPPRLLETMTARATQVLRNEALAEQGMVHWAPMFGQARTGVPGKRLVQDCHGSPGIICRLAGTRSAEIQALLRQGGEGAWAAGPLNKGPGLCHGTAGNGYAFLKLHAMTGEAMWLARARAFAMHAISQSNAEATQHGQRRFSLWTGDLGLAVYLWACVSGDAAFPTLDVF